MKHRVKLIASPFESDVAAICAIPFGRRTRWILAAKASPKRIAKIAFTDDFGKTFKEIDVGNMRGEGALAGGAFAVLLDGIWFATNKQNLYRSMDKGETWILKAKIEPRYRLSAT